MVWRYGFDRFEVCLQDFLWELSLYADLLLWHLHPHLNFFLSTLPRRPCLSLYCSRRDRSSPLPSFLVLLLQLLYPCLQHRDPRPIFVHDLHQASLIIYHRQHLIQLLSVHPIERVADRLLVSLGHTSLVLVLFVVLIVVDCDCLSSLRVELLADTWVLELLWEWHWTDPFFRGGTWWNFVVLVCSGVFIIVYVDIDDKFTDSIILFHQVLNADFTESLTIVVNKQRLFALSAIDDIIDMLWTSEIAFLSSTDFLKFPVFGI